MDFALQPSTSAVPFPPMPRLRIVLLTFGDRIETHWQAHHCLLTTMAHAPADTEYVLVTDRADHYRWFAGRVRFLPVDPAQLAIWKGAHGFFWRVKLEAVLAAARLDGVGSAHTCYLDSDILCRQPLTDLVAALAVGDTFMHLQESVFSHARRSSHRTLRDHLVGKSIAGLPITGDNAMWNAGVVAVGAGQVDLLVRALALCDAIITADYTHRLAEQFAFSAALQSSGRLRPAEAWFDHYWANKPGFQQSITEQLATFLVRGMGVDEAVAFARANPIRRPLSVRRRWYHRLFAPLAGRPG